MTEFSITQPNGTDLRAYGTDTAALPNGNIVVVWDQTSSDANIEETIGIRVLAADGTAVSNEFFTQSATAAAPPNRFEDGPEVIAIDDTHFVVAWSSFNNTNGVYEIHARTVTLSGATLSFGPDKLISDTTKDGTGQLSLARMDNGNIAFAWGEFAADYLSSRAVVRIMDSSLDPLSPITQVSQNTAAGIGFVEIIANGNALSVAWKQNAGVGSIPTFAYQFTANANGTIPALTLGDITVRSGQTQLHDFVELANGDLLVLTIGGPDTAGSLNDGDRLFGTIYNSTLTSVVKPTFQINQNEQSTGVVYSEAFAFAGGGFGIVFDQEADSLVPNDNNRDVFYRIYDNTYTAVGNQVALHAPNGAGVTDSLPSGVVTSADGDVTFVWERKNGAAGEVLVGQQINNLEPNPPAQPPTVAINTGSSLNEGGLDVIAATELDTNDPDTADGSLVYTVTTATVANGSLWVDTDGSGTINGGEAALGLGGTFTQANINAGLLKYRHNGGETTADSFGFSVTDGTTPVTGQTFNFTVNAVDDPAIAVDDAFSTDEVTSLGAGLSVFDANPTTPDSDPDNPLTVTEVDGVAASVGTQITLASGALLTVDSDGTFAYDPNGAFEDLAAPGSGAANTSTTDSFTYTVTGGDIATVTITITGVDNDDAPVGTGVGELIDAGIGADEVTGLGGDDSLDGGAGNDTLFGGADNDVLQGEGDRDVLFGEAGDDTLSGGDGNDIFAGGAGADSFTGGTGIDVVSYRQAGAGIGLDLVNGLNNAGEAVGDSFLEIERITGSDHADTMSGSAGADYFGGNAGADALVGLGGADLLFGGAGNDTLTGGTGRDALTGGADADLFVFSAGDSAAGALRDGIRDFVRGEDHIDLSSMGLSFVAAFTGAGNEVRVTNFGTATIVSIDIDGNKIADSQIAVAFVTGMDASDFVL